jgi:hypothetical protein
MKTFYKPIDLILEVRAESKESKGKHDVEKYLEAQGVHIVTKRKLLNSGSLVVSKGQKSKPASIEKWQVRTKIEDSEVNSWDLAHLGLQAREKSIGYIEPDHYNSFPVADKAGPSMESYRKAILGTEPIDDGIDPDWPPARNLVWHLDDQHSQLKSARDSVAGLNSIIRIGHLDTGYTDHFVIPSGIKSNPLQRNFVDDEPSNSALDPLVEGTLKQPGHGTGTLSILAGNKTRLSTATGVFDDYLGGAPFAEVICCRIAKSVILFKTSSFADALEYLIDLSLTGTPIHVVSMSMGGAPSKTWIDAINKAYMAGITLVTAAGNNFAGLPTRHLVYPARFKRVIAACGVGYDYRPYYTRLVNEMQGNFGPDRYMDHALAAFTPNIPWASARNKNILFSGAGTSSATPQIAAAAAIYYRKYNSELQKLEPWQRVEAIRNALFSTALKKIKKGFSPMNQYFGNGILQANDALSVPVIKRTKPTAEAELPWFPILNTLFKAMPGKDESSRLAMYNTELAQLVFLYPELCQLIGNDQREYESVKPSSWKRFTKAIIEHPSASKSLKRFLEERYKILKSTN